VAFFFYFLNADVFLLYQKLKTTKTIIRITFTLRSMQDGSQSLTLRT